MLAPVPPVKFRDPRNPGLGVGGVRERGSDLHPHTSIPISELDVYTHGPVASLLDPRRFTSHEVTSDCHAHQSTVN